VREKGPPAEATPGDPSGCEVEEPSGARRRSSDRRCRFAGLGSAGLAHFRSGKTDGTPLSSGETEDRSLVETSRESGVPAREPPTRALGKALERRTVALPEGGGGKRRKEGAGKPVPRCAGKALERRKKPKRVSALLASARMGTDPRGEQRPEAAGHRGLLVLRAGERDAMNGKRATAPKGVRLREGETLCRVNPMSGTGPSGPEGVGGRKPSRG